MPQYHTDPDLRTWAELIIEEKMPHLKEVMIAYMFRPEAPISNGRAVAGMCIRSDDRHYTVHGYDFLIEISEDIWREATDQFREALMAHELCHIGLRRDAEGKLERDERGRIKSYTKPHDIEEFEMILAQYGAYHKKLREFIDAFTVHKMRKKKAAAAEKVAEEDLLPVEA